MVQGSRVLIVVSMVLAVVGCATLQPDFEAPTVNVRAIRPLPSDHLTPQFDITLQIVNPNRSPLVLHGIAYTLKLEGHDILTGVANELPTIDGYGEGEITLTATTSLLSGIRFFADLMRHQRKVIAYELTAKLDPGGLRPAIHVSETGEIDFSAQRSTP